MRAKIKAIFEHQWGNLLGIGKSAKEIEILMCYREIRAVGEFVGRNYLIPGYEDDLFEQLREDYPETVVTKAIEKYKNQKK